MKNKTGMTKLRNKIVWCFLVVVFAVRVIDSAIDSTWDTLIAPALYPNGDYTGVFDTGTMCYMAASFAVYLISAVIFYIMVKKMIEKESHRQVSEQNLLYAAIAHDIRTPLTSVQGFAKALLEEKIKEAERAEIYGIIYRKSKSMNTLVDTLFEYAKFGTQEYSLTFTEIDLAVLVRDIAAEYYCDFEEHNIALSIDIPEHPVLMRADKKELKRAISNLVVNTYKHNPSGIHVLIRLKSDGKNAELCIADSGNKIPNEMNVFEPFVTENTSRSIGKGTGLGLAITKRILDAHHAKITVKEDMPEYTKAFVVELHQHG